MKCLVQVRVKFSPIIFLLSEIAGWDQTKMQIHQIPSFLLSKQSAAQRWRVAPAAAPAAALAQRSGRWLFER